MASLLAAEAAELAAADAAAASLRDAEAELARLTAATEEMDAMEARFWHDYNDFRLQLLRYVDDRDALLARIAHATEQREELRKTNVFNDAFHIWHDGPFGTINGLRLGRTGGAGLFPSDAARGLQAPPICPGESVSPGRPVRQVLRFALRKRPSVSLFLCCCCVRSGACGVGRDQRCLGPGRPPPRHDGPHMPLHFLKCVRRAHAAACAPPFGRGGSCAYFSSFLLPRRLPPAASAYALLPMGSSPRVRDSARGATYDLFGARNELARRLLPAALSSPAARMRGKRPVTAPRPTSTPRRPRQQRQRVCQPAVRQGHLRLPGVPAGVCGVRARQGRVERRREAVRDELQD